MKVNELEGAQLDYWVASAEIKQGVGQTTGCQIRALSGDRWVLFDPDDGAPVMIICSGFRALIQARKELKADRLVDRYAPSETWANGGPIIEREHIAIQAIMVGKWCAEKWVGEPRTREDKFVMEYGETPLVSAMRAYVASKFGDTVPDEVEA